MIGILPLALPWALGALLLGLDGRRRAVWSAAAIGLALVLFLDLLLLVRGREVELVTGGWPAEIGIRLRSDPLAHLFGALTAGVLLAVLVHEARSGLQSRLFPALVLLLATGLHGTFLTGDLFNFYVFFELSIVTSFVLAAYGYGRAEVRGTYAYIAVNLLGSVIFLTGVADTYHELGALDFQRIQALHEASEPTTGKLSGALLFAALAIKLGLFPFHGWLPVLYSHAHPAVAAAMGGALVNVGAYGMLRVGFGSFEGARASGAPLLLVLGAAGALYGSLLAVRRDTASEVAAYSSVAHAGYLVLAVGIGGVAGAAAAILVVLASSLDKATMFLSLGAAPAACAAGALVAACSVAGLPPSIGFVMKLRLFDACLEGPAAGALVLAVGLSSLLAMAAAFRFRTLALRRPPRVPVAPGAAALLLAAAVVGLGIWPGPLLELVEALARGLAIGEAL